MYAIGIIFSAIRILYAEYECETEWITFNVTGYQYKWDCVKPISLGSGKGANFYEAEGKCQEMKGHLVSIHNDEENDFVADLIGSDKEYHTWIGLQRTENRSVWRWTDGSEMDFSKWDIDQPDGSPNDKDNCAHIYNVIRGEPLDREKKWNDALCYWSEYYVCKKRA
ncbi:lectin C-type domain protein [Ancylostoma duodenale]|uniref:Lectin C-type domain protein n=1 Tax=Ancylostoma duodenale TaxID=51022 RepID=A0A0C2HB75_9BILA|nr:lectin C-type domain protein [Ancylostoma duodenale]